jgi:hypothetical protein
MSDDGAKGFDDPTSVRRGFSANDPTSLFTFMQLQIDQTTRVPLKFMEGNPPTPSPGQPTLHPQDCGGAIIYVYRVHLGAP